MFPISTVPRLRDVLARQLARTESVEKATNRIIPCSSTGKGGPSSRSAVRGSRAAMAMVGHKTESAYRRYAIVEEGMLNEQA